MSTPRRTALLLAGALVVLPALAACGGDEPVASRPATAVDERLRSRLPADVRERGELLVATDPSYAPASSYDEDGRTIVGFEPDLGDELGALLGVDVRFVDTGFTGILERVDAGEVDVAISSITDTADREALVDFVTYFSAGTSIVVQRGNPAGVTGIDDLCGAVVAVEAETVQVDLLDRQQQHCEAPVDVVEQPSNADALLLLRTGRASAVLNDYPPAAHLTTDPRTRGQYQLATTAQYEPGLYGIAVAKRDTALREVLRDAVDALIASGAYARVLERWAVEHGAVREASVNAAA